jgi:hypothetical protein
MEWKGPNHRDAGSNIEQKIVRIGGILLLMFHLVGIIKVELEHLFRLRGILL